MEIGIMGFGTFGKYMARHLATKADVFVTDQTDKTKEAQEIQVQFSTLDEVASKKYVIIAVPMEVFEESLNLIKDKLQPGTLVLDVCSLKVFSCQLMENLLPENIDIIGTHPLFGPQSAWESVKNMKLALCNVRSNQFEKVRKFCLDMEMDVVVTTPDEHDKQMALSQALTHFIGQVAKRMNMKRVELSTKTFDDLMDIMEMMKNDSRALFENMQAFNPHAKEQRDKFLNEWQELSKKVDEL